MTQLYFFILLACTEHILLAAMAYDRYVATCHPLRYSVIMTTGYCGQLVAFSYMSGFMVSVIKVYFISHVAFCGSNVMNHFFCDISPILKMACKDMSTAELVDFALAVAILVFPLITTVLSYIYIVSTILHIPSIQGRKKAFSTCASHLTVVIICYTAMIFMYVQPRAIASFNSNKLISAVCSPHTHAKSIHLLPKEPGSQKCYQKDLEGWLMSPSQLSPADLRRRRCPRRMPFP